jgi:hypothetical protein
MRQQIAAGRSKPVIFLITDSFLSTAELGRECLFKYDADAPHFNISVGRQKFVDLFDEFDLYQISVSFLTIETVLNSDALLHPGGLVGLFKELNAPPPDRVYMLMGMRDLKEYQMTHQPHELFIEQMLDLFSVIHTQFNAPISWLSMGIVRSDAPFKTYWKRIKIKMIKKGRMKEFPAWFEYVDNVINHRPDELICPIGCHWEPSVNEFVANKFRDVLREQFFGLKNE